MGAEVTRQTLARHQTGAGDGMHSHRVSTDDLESELRDHVGFLLSSAAAYDAGNTGEAKRLAVELRILLKDSFLDNLGCRSAMPFYDTCHPYSADNALAHYGLVLIRYREVLPVFDKKGEARSFVSWPAWSDAVVLSDGQGGTLSRLELVKTVADKRGAHVDLSLPPLYVRLTDSRSAAYRGEGDCMVFLFGEPGAKPMGDDHFLLPDPVAPTIRQIAHEVLVSIAEFRPAAFAHVSDLDATLASKHSRLGLRGVFMSRDAPLAAEGPLTFSVRRDVRSADGDTLG